jgi:hypothetical protein
MTTFELVVRTIPVRAQLRSAKLREICIRGIFQRACTVSMSKQQPDAFDAKP